MKRLFNKRMAETFLQRAANKFCESNAGWNHKSLLMSMIPNIQVHVTNKLKSSWGQVRLTDSTDVEVLPYYIHSMGHMYIHIDLNRRLMQWAKPQDGFDTVAHELAHCLDYVIRGTTYHDEHWRELALAMGCDGNAFSDIEVPKYVCETKILEPTMRKGYNDSY